MTRNKPVIPTFIGEIAELNELRNQSFDKLEQNQVRKRDLTNAINAMSLFREQMAAIRPKKEKKQKYGVTGMDDLVKLVATLKQDVKQIKDAQSVQSANEWIQRHKLGDLYEARGKDLDGDGKPEVVVQTKNGQKPVIVNGYTTVPTLFPYRNAYYTTYPTVDQRKEAHKQGMNLRGWINSIYEPQYDETGRAVTNYSGEGWQDFENHLTKAGIDPQRLIKPKGRSTYQAFVSRCVSPIYQAIKYLNGAKLPFSLTEMASVIWNQFALIPAMVYVYGDNISSVSDEQWKNLRGKKSVKTAIAIIVNEYLVNPVKISELVPTACEMCNKSDMPVESEHVPLVSKVTIAIIMHGLGALPPNPSNFNEWFDQNVQPQMTALEAQATTPAIVEEIDDDEE